MAILRLIAACPERGIDRNTLVAVRSETTANRLVFVGQESDVIENRGRPQRVFAGSR